MPTDRRTGRRKPLPDPQAKADAARRKWAEQTAREQADALLADLNQRIKDFLESKVETFITDSGRHETRLKSGARGQFVSDMKERFGGKGDEGAGRITDTLSTTRLDLVFDTAVKTEWGRAQWVEGNQSDLLAAFPAARFVRIGFVQEPRPIHEAHLGEVHLKSNVKFWLSMNTKEDGGFETPYPPFGFNSQCDWEDVPFEEALAELPAEEADELRSQGVKNPADEL